jgi:tRNA/tmRNA/rRNA uracil-C5-methylase (TrmA/RlmC/RlmD family)
MFASKKHVLDAFVGSGTTLIAAEKTGRRGYGIEIDPAYRDVTIRRLHRVCGLNAVLEATGQHFAIRRWASRRRAQDLRPVHRSSEMDFPSIIPT